MLSGFDTYVPKNIAISNAAVTATARRIPTHPKKGKWFFEFLSILILVKKSTAYKTHNMALQAASV